MSQNRKKPNRFQKRNRGGKTFLIVFLCFLLFVFLCVAAIYGLFSHFYNKMNPTAPAEPTPGFEVLAEPEPVISLASTPSPQDSPQEAIDAAEEELRRNLAAGAEELAFDEEDVYNILLIGSDPRGEEAGRSDSMILVSINRETKKILLTSLMRDIYLSIPGYGNDRLNAAYSYGGPELLMETIRSNFRIPVEEYVQVDFQSFVDVVDILGGVTVDVSTEENAVMQSGGWEVDADPLPADQVGRVNLNGGQALIYVRMRNVGASDFDRTARQREVMNALFEKAKGMSLSQLNELANAVLPRISTNLRQGEIFDILLHAVEYLGYEMQSHRLPIDGGYSDLVIRGMMVLGLDWESNLASWQKAVYE